jgi:hypothetical protein
MLVVVVAGAVATLCQAPVSLAEAAAAAPAPSTTTAGGATDGVIDPRATAVLRRMSDFLTSQRKFTFHAESSLEAVLQSGEKLTYDFDVQGAVSRPHGLWARRVGDREESFYYDGKSITIYQSRPNYYASTPAPQSLDEALTFAQDQLGLDAPAADLLSGNVYAILTDGVTAGQYLGSDTVAGVVCDHLAFQKSDVDIQLWVAQGKQPLPVKYVIISKSELSAPEYSTVITQWNLRPSLGKKTFTFKPPPGAQKIPFWHGAGGSKQ